MKPAFWLALALLLPILGDVAAPMARVVAQPAVVAVALPALALGDARALGASILLHGIGSPASAEPPPVVPKPPEPEPEAEPESPKLEPPILRIRAPEVVEIGQMAHIHFELTGGPVRELAVEFDPPFAAEDTERHIASLVQPDPENIYIASAAGVRTVTVLAIGRDVGFAKQEARILFKDPRPPVRTEAAKAPQGPRELMARWMAGIRSNNKESEAQEVAAAGREIAGKLRDKEITDNQVVEKWQEAAYLRLGSAFKAWNAPAPDKSFFDYVGELFQDNAKLAGANAANLLDGLCDILEGK